MDTCKICNKLNMLFQTRNETSCNAKIELEEHHDEVVVLNAIRKDFQNSTLLSTYKKFSHYQGLFTHPCITHSRQLSCYNFGIHVANTNNDGMICVWHESTVGIMLQGFCCMRSTIVL